MATAKQYWDRAEVIENAWQSIRNDVDQMSYITDACVDSENSAHCEFESPEYWDAMLFSLDNSAGMRLEEMGIKIKDFPIALNY